MLIHLIDTDIIIDYLRGYHKSISFLESLSGTMLLSAITIAELYAGAREKEYHALERFLRSFEIVSLDHHIAKLGGQLRQQYGKSHGMGLADALIAATAIHQEATLVTLNTRHYPMMKGIVAPYHKS